MSDDNIKLDPRFNMAPATVERRAVRRHSCVLRITCYQITGQGTDPWTAAVRDISESGIGIVHSQPIENGAFLVLEVPFSNENVARSLGASVIHSTPRPEGGFAIGCVFDQRLSEADLKLLLDDNLLDL